MHHLKRNLMAEDLSELNTAVWHQEKNGTARLEDFGRGSHKKAWWQCPRGHVWESPIYSVLSGCGCPYCAGKLPIPGETDLATTHPSLAAEWETEKNDGLRPMDVTRGSIKSVWWRCPEGHSYEARIFSRVAGTGCPYCAGKKVLAGFNDLATTDPTVAEQWYFPLNDGLSPSGVTRGSHKKVWWQCAEGHVWLAAIYSRTRKRAADCPVCTGKTIPRSYNKITVKKRHAQSIPSTADSPLESMHKSFRHA